MTNSIINGILIVTFAGLAVSTKGCDSAEKKSAATTECPADILCTMDYRSITLNITDQANKPVVLDSFYSTLNATGEHLITKAAARIWSSENAHHNGSYLVVDDGHKALVGKEGKTVTFSGFKNGKRVVTENWVVGHDCCHVILISGDKDIQLKDTF